MFKREATLAKKILVVDDTPQLCILLKSYLTQEGYDVILAGNGYEALKAASNEKPDLIILDLMMPEMDGYEFMRIYTKEEDTPVIILTARLEENDKVVGLELGADDYITKPFSMRELTARIHAVLRRTEKTTKGKDILKVAGVELNRITRIVEINGKQVDLTPSEFEMLAAMLSAPGKVFLTPRAAGAHPGHRLRRLRTHHRCPHPQPADQDRAGRIQPAVHRNSLRHRLSLYPAA